MKNNVALSHTQYNEMKKTIDELKNKNRHEIDKLQFELSDLKELSKQKEDDLEQ